MDEQPNELHRGFGLSTATYVVIACMVGAGILVSPGYMMLSLENYPVILGLWVIGGLLALCGALCVAELATMFPEAGGEYVYIREAYGRMPAFLAGWQALILGFAAPLAVTSYVAAVNVFAGLGISDDAGRPWLPIAAAAIIVAVTIPNLLGHRHSARTQSVTTILKLTLFVGLVIAGFAVGEGQLTNLGEGKPARDVDVGEAATQLLYVMFAYSGWNAAAYIAGEVKDPSRVLPRALLLGTASVVILYLALNLVFAYAVPLDDPRLSAAAGQQRLPQLAAERLFGPRISNAFSVGVGLAFLATVSAFIVTGPRIYFAMARDGLFPAVAGRLHARTQVPVYAMIFQSLCAVGILFLSDFQSIYEYSAVGMAVFSLLFISAVYVLRWHQPALARPFKIPGYPVVPAVYLGITVFMIVFAFQRWPTQSKYSLGSILIGIPLYYIWQAATGRRGSSAR